MVRPLTGMQTGIGPFLNEAEPDVETIKGHITRLQEHVLWPRGTKEAYSHEYIATVEDGYDLQLPPDAGRELMDAYRDDRDLTVTGKQRTKSGSVTVEGEIYVEDKPMWKIRNEWDEDAGFGYRGKKIYAKPL